MNPGFAANAAPAAVSTRKVSITQTKLEDLDKALAVSNDVAFKVDLVKTKKNKKTGAVAPAPGATNVIKTRVPDYLIASGKKGWKGQVRIDVLVREPKRLYVVYVYDTESNLESARNSVNLALTGKSFRVESVGYRPEDIIAVQDNFPAAAPRKSSKLTEDEFEYTKRLIMYQKAINKTKRNFVSSKPAGAAANPTVTLQQKLTELANKGGVLVMSTRTSKDGVTTASYSLYNSVGGGLKFRKASGTGKGSDIDSSKLIVAGSLAVKSTAGIERLRKFIGEVSDATHTIADPNVAARVAALVQQAIVAYDARVAAFAPAPQMAPRSPTIPRRAPMIAGGSA